MRHEHVLGDLQLHPDGTVDGWCFSPARPEARLAFDILVDDRVVAGGEAALPRPDLAVPGMTDARHGFWLPLPPGAIDRGAPSLVSARARASMVVFGRRLLEPPGSTAPEPPVAALQAALGALSVRLADCAARHRPAPAGAALRQAAGVLAAALPGGATRRGADVAAARRVLATMLGPLHLACPAAPRVSLVLRASEAATGTIARLQAVAPATHALQAETLLVDPGHDARTALLPSLVPGLRLAPARGAAPEATLAIAQAGVRGAWLLLLDDEQPPSSAGVQDLVARLEAESAVLAVAGQGAAGMKRLALGSRAGVALAVRRELPGEGDTPASLLARALRQKAACVALTEPWPRPG